MNMASLMPTLTNLFLVAEIFKLLASQPPKNITYQRCLSRALESQKDQATYLLMFFGNSLIIILDIFQAISKLHLRNIEAQMMSH